MPSKTRKSKPDVPPQERPQSASPEAKPPGSLDRLAEQICEEREMRFALFFREKCKDIHLKDLTVDDVDDERHIVVNGRQLVNFGSDSFLGLDRDPRVQKVMVEALEHWGTHNGASRMFSSVKLCPEAERRLADWLQVEETLIFPSVTLANVGLLPALVGPGDLLVLDRQSHDSLHQGAHIATDCGATFRELTTASASALEKLLQNEQYDRCVVVIDGVYSMTGKIPPLKELDEVARKYGGILYVDDAHGTAVIGERGRGAAYEVLGTLENVLMVGSLSKAFSCLGAFVTCNRELKDLLKMRSSTYIFGGPVPPPYLAAICAVCDIIESPEFDDLQGRLDGLVKRLTDGLKAHKLVVLGGAHPIVSVMVGDLEETMLAGKWLFDRGYYVQSAIYPAVALNSGLLRIQVNANHTDEAIDGLVEAFGELKTEMDLPTSSA